jgi:folylpolyglutamate synthase/dihydropteroate synthase
MREKDILGIFRELLSLPNPFFLCATVATDRAASAQHLFDCIKGKVPAKRFQTVSEAIRFAHSNLDEDDTLLVCGSLYTVAEALSFYGLSV